MSCKKAWPIVGALGVIMMLALPSMAAETAQGGGFDRHTWDEIMRLINFGILAFVIYRYGKAPLLNFLAGQRAEKVFLFEQFTQTEQDLSRQQKEQQAMFAQMDERIEKIKAHYHEIGRQEQNEILAEAEKSREQLLASAKQMVDFDFKRAVQQFRRELVELAVQLAEERIQKNINEKDQSLLVQNYLSQLATVEGRSPSAEQSS